jgi:hypothetical protein
VEFAYYYGAAINPTALLAMEAVQQALDARGATGFEVGLPRLAAKVVRCLQGGDTEGVKAACAVMLKAIEKLAAGTPTDVPDWKPLETCGVLSRLPDAD